MVKSYDNSLKIKKKKKVVCITKAKTKSKAKTRKAKQVLDEIDLDNLDDLDEQINNIQSDTESDNDSDSNSSDNSEEKSNVVQEYKMDEYEARHAGSDRHTKLKDILFETFGYKSFKPHQYKIIDTIINETDVLGIMPTGYGKSICFQIPPLFTNELAIVISPLIALMADQIDSMNKLGINSCSYNSTIGIKRKKEMMEELLNGHYQILYVTPESLDSPEFRRLIDKIYENVGICMVAVDEAHCVSSYGFDFRPAYRNIVKVRKFLPDIPVLAVTATATLKVEKDIKRCLEMDNALQVKTSFDRPNIFINVEEVRQDSFDKICDLVQNCNGPSIIYCITKKETINMCFKLNQKKIKTVTYHGDMKKDERTDAQNKFMKDEVGCICATVAFGMGINKPDVRLVIHKGCPKNIESYYQEIGRAGRDGKDSECWLFFSQRDFRIQQLFIDKIKDPVFKTTRIQLMYVMRKYIDGNTCRRKNMLAYFSEIYPKTNCKKCDNCCAIKKTIAKKDEDDLFKLLSTVHEMDSSHNSQCGKSKIKLILRGSNAKNIKEWMKDLPFYGSFKNKSVLLSTEIIDNAMTLGYLENHHIGDMINIIRCTEYGQEFGTIYQEKLNKVSKKKVSKKKVSKKKVMKKSKKY
jgi:Werner syndrome ATP-dependent helicase